MNRAVEVLAQKAARGGRGTGAAMAPLRELGAHPDGGPVQVMAGRYGPYVKWEKVNATLPKELTPEAVTLEEALALIAEKAAKGGKGKSGRATARTTKAKAKPKTARTAKSKKAKGT